MDWWVGGLVMGGVVLVAGLVFLAKRWASEGEATISYKAVKVAGSPAFLVFAVGAGFAGYSIVQLADTQHERRVADTQRERQDPSLVLGQIRDVGDVRPFRFRSADVTPESLQAFGQWLVEFYRARISIDKGIDDGLRKNQLVTTLDDRVTPQRVRRSELGTYNSDGTAMLRLVNVYPRESVAQLTEVSIDPWMRRAENIATGAPVPGPVTKGQRVLALPQEETDAAEDVQNALEAATAEGVDRAARRSSYRQAVDEAERFFLDHPDSFFTPDVLFQLGDAQRGLGRRADALVTFERFVERYPFHRSADGAEGRIDRPKRSKKPTG